MAKKKKPPISPTHADMVELASSIVSKWDLEDLIKFAEDRIVESYKCHLGRFASDWKIYHE